MNSYDVPCKKKKCLLACVWFWYRWNKSLPGSWFIISQYCFFHLSRFYDCLQNMELIGSGSHTECRVGSQQFTITNSWEDIYLTCLALMNHTTMSQALSQKKKEVIYKTTSVCMSSSMTFASTQTVSLAIIARLQTWTLLMFVQWRAWKQEWHDVMLSYLDSIYCIIMIACMFDNIMDNAPCQCLFDIVILAHHLEWWHRVPLVICLGHLLFALTASEQ